MPAEIDHVAFVDAWLARSARGLSPEQLVQLLDAALRAVLIRTETTLGDVTLAAIVDRVLSNTVETFPNFASLRYEAGRGVRCEELRAQASTLHVRELREGARFVIGELLRVLGALTAEILTPELHAELSKIAPPSESALPEDTTP